MTDSFHHPHVAAVACRGGHFFSKTQQDSIELVAGVGVRGDGHSGATVQHRSRVRRDPTAPNLRQVHLLHAELFEQLAGQGYQVEAGDLGENITTCGLDLLSLPRGSVLAVGSARIEVTGLRNPCSQIDTFSRGLLAAVLERRGDGSVVRRAGVMGVVLVGGPVVPGDRIDVVSPAGPEARLEPV